MRNSNSKETRKAVEAYVLAELEAVNERAEYDGNYTPTRPITSAFEVLRDEMDSQSYYGPASDLPVMGAGLAAKYEAAGRYDHYAATTPYRVMWLYAAIGELEVYTSDIYAKLAEWLDETLQEAARYTDTEAERKFYHLTAQAFERLYERETTPRRIPTPVFKSLYQERNGGYFFNRDNMRYHQQTMKDVSVTGYHLITDDHGRRRDCYRVESMQASDPEGQRHLVTYYYDRETLQSVNPAKEA